MCVEDIEVDGGGGGGCESFERNVSCETLRCYDVREKTDRRHRRKCGGCWFVVGEVVVIGGCVCGEGVKICGGCGGGSREKEFTLRL